MPDRDRWAEFDAWLSAALDLEPDDRDAFIRERCPDPEDRARLRRLIAAAETKDDSLRPGGAVDGGLGAALVESLDDDDGDAIAGETIPGYRPVRRVGRGGMGDVWEAEQIEPVSRRVAIKFVRRGMDVGHVLARFRSEQQSLARMQHPGIAQVYDAGRTDSGRPYFAMEFVDGPPITTYADDAELPLRDRLRLFRDVCDAVQHAHRRGIIHRDLKPSNVLVASVDGVPTPKVIDFGIARAVEGPLAPERTLTEVGQIVGTPEYMSPEQAGGDPADVDTRTDVYALGVLLYELATGAVPIARTDGGAAGLVDLFRRVRDEEPVRPSRRVSGPDDGAATAAGRRGATPAGLARELRGDVDWIALRALEKDRAKRYGSAAELSGDVGRYLRDEPVEAGPPGTVYRLRKFVRRNSGLLTAAAAVLVALVAGLIGTWTGLVRARVEAERARTSAAVAQEVNRFLNEDLLAAVAPGARGRDVGVREVLDAAASRLDGRFPDQPEVEASVRSTIGDTYMRLGRLDDASPQLERALALYEATLGPSHVDTLSALHALAELRFYQGRVDEAAALFERLVEERTRTLGPTAPETLSALSDRGTIAHDRGDLDRAERDYRTALEGAREALGEDDPYTLSMLHNLGALLRDRARYEEAEAFLRQAWEGTRARLGNEHPDALATRSLLGSVLREMGRLDEARPVSREVFEARRRVLGDEHPSTLLSANNLAMLHADLGELAEAERLQRFALEGQRASLGDDHDAVILSWGNLGAILTRDGRAGEAVPILAEDVARARRVLGAEHPLTGQTLRKYADALLAADRFADAEHALLEAHAIVAASLGSGHPDAVRAAASLVALYEVQGRDADADRWREAAAPAHAP